MRSSLFIINPAAGHGRAGRAWAAMEPEAMRLLPDPGRVFTERPGHACELAREAVLGGAAMVVAVGGDGTFSEALEA